MHACYNTLGAEDSSDLLNIFLATHRQISLASFHVRICHSLEKSQISSGHTQISCFICYGAMRMIAQDLFCLPCGHHGTIALITKMEILIRGPSTQPYCEKCHPVRQPDACTFFIFPVKMMSTKTKTS